MDSITRWAPKKSISVAIALVVMFLVTVCNFSSNSLPVNARSLIVTQAFAVLNHAPRGSAGLLWSKSKNTLIVAVALSGLAPNSTHPGAIHIGNCNSHTYGPVVLGLNPINADNTGKGSSVTAFSNVLRGIPAHGWYIEVRNGPELVDNLQRERIACANITNPHALITTPQPPNPNLLIKMTREMLLNGNPTLTSLTSYNPSLSNTSRLAGNSSQIVNVAFGGSADDNQSITLGAVELSRRWHNGQEGLWVKISLYHLAPSSTHVARIRSGSCEDQGPVVEQLNAVHVDALGVGTSATFLSDISSIPSTGWYVNVNLASAVDDLDDQTGFDPIACGNIVPSLSSAPSPTLSVSPSATPTPFAS
jgi:hypothetical protein